MLENTVDRIRTSGKYSATDLSLHWLVLLLCDEIVRSNIAKQVPQQRFTSRVRNLTRLLQSFMSCDSFGTYKSALKTNVNGNISAIDCPILFSVHMVNAVLEVLTLSDIPKHTHMHDSALLVTMVKLMCEAMPERLTIQDTDGFSALHMAASLHNSNHAHISTSSIARQLHKENEGIEDDDSMMISTLSTQTTSNFCRLTAFGIVKAIVGRCPSAVYIPDNHQHLPVHCAAASGNSEAMMYLIHCAPQTLLSVQSHGSVSVLAAALMSHPSHNPSILKALLAANPSECMMSSLVGAYPLLLLAIDNHSIPLDVIISILGTCCLRDAAVDTLCGVRCLASAMRRLSLEQQHCQRSDSELLIFALLQKFPQLARVYDERHCCAIQEAAKNKRATIRLLQYLFQLYPDALYLVDVTGNTILHHLVSSQRSNKELLDSIRWVIKSQSSTGIQGGSCLIDKRNNFGLSAFQLLGLLRPCLFLSDVHNMFPVVISNQHNKDNKTFMLPVTHRCMSNKTIVHRSSGDEDIQTIKRLFLMNSMRLTSSERTVLHGLNWECRKLVLCCWSRNLRSQHNHQSVATFMKTLRVDVDVDVSCANSYTRFTHSYNNKKRKLDLGNDKSSNDAFPGNSSLHKLIKITESSAGATSLVRSSSALESMTPAVAPPLDSLAFILRNLSCIDIIKSIVAYL